MKISGPYCTEVTTDKSGAESYKVEMRVGHRSFSARGSSVKEAVARITHRVEQYLTAKGITLNEQER